MKKYKKAVALKYDERADPAPQVVARGAGEIAKKIIMVGKDDDIPIIDDDQMLHLLYPLQQGEFIPESLYAPVAKLLAYFVYYKQQGLINKTFELNR